MRFVVLVLPMGKRSADKQMDSSGSIPLFTSPFPSPLYLLSSRRIQSAGVTSVWFEPYAQGKTVS